jgi:hypothetical protein
LIRNDTRTPKILKQILWLVLFAFLTTAVASAIMMGLFVSDSLNTQSNVKILTQALQRGIYTSQVMSLLRSLIDHNLGIESSQVLLQTETWSGIVKGFQSIDPLLSNIIINRLEEL